MYVGRRLTRLRDTEVRLADEFRRIAERHADEFGVAHVCHLLARQCLAHANLLGPHLERYAGVRPDDEPEESQPTDSVRGFVRRKVSEASGRRQTPGLMLLDDLADLYLAIAEVELLWVQAGQAARALRDDGLLDTVSRCDEQTTTQQRWVQTRIKEIAPQTLVVG